MTGVIKQVLTNAYFKGLFNFKPNIMKNFLNFILAIAVIGLFTACSSSDEFESENVDAFKHHEGKMVTLGFNVHFIGEYQYQAPDAAICGNFPPMIRVINTGTGEGRGTHFKKLTSYFDFCVDITDASYPNGYMIAYLTDEDGDVLNVSIPDGHVIQGRVPGMPSYAVSYFKDEFFIVGGTGKFEGATGSGYTNDYNFPVEEDGYNWPHKTSHHWQGTITMKKGK